MQADKSHIDRKCDATTAKPVETFFLQADPLTGWAIEPAPTYRQVVPVYDAETLELREFLP
jgi:hypothetical protein